MVWALSGEPIAAMACTPADTVASLRGELELQTGLVGPWRLLLGDRLLRDPWTLHSMGIGEGSIVQVVRTKPHLVVTASGDRTARLWNSTSGKCLRTLKGHRGHVRCAAFSPDGELVVTASDDWTAKLWSSMSGECLRTLEGHESMLRFAAFSPDGDLVVTASDDRTAKLWSSMSGECLRTLEGHRGAVRCAAFSPV